MGKDKIIILFSLIVAGYLVYALGFGSQTEVHSSISSIEGVHKVDIKPDTNDTVLPQFQSQNHLPPATARVSLTILDIVKNDGDEPYLSARINEVLGYGPYTEVIGVGQELTVLLSSNDSTNSSWLETIKLGLEYKVVITLVRMPMTQDHGEVQNWVLNKIE